MIHSIPPRVGMLSNTQKRYFTDMLFRIEELTSSPTIAEICKICNKGMVLKIVLTECLHECCQNCLFEVAKGCPQCKSDDVLGEDSNVEESEGRTPEKEANCSICLGEKQNTAVVNECFHSFCFNCITTWAKKSKQCPLCRKRFSQIYYDIKDNKTFKTLNRNFSTSDYNSLFDAEEARIRISRLNDKRRALQSDLSAQNGNGQNQSASIGSEVSEIVQSNVRHRTTHSRRNREERPESGRVSVRREGDSLQRTETNVSVFEDIIPHCPANTATCREVRNDSSAAHSSIPVVEMAELNIDNSHIPSVYSGFEILDGTTAQNSLNSVTLPPRIRSKPRAYRNPAPCPETSPARSPEASPAPPSTSTNTDKSRRSNFMAKKFQKWCRNVLSRGDK